ncbi:hypothetical protein HOE67_03980 [Candidatus Peregrinibacteria bacterium]|jgi:hypothetical protein|nr:hypothetical protein [Candidatus Peregrinibacteria bacterium]MBT4056244.1 hypothetical protein [Candidatus Peregrinibacteria bacterium]
MELSILVAQIIALVYLSLGLGLLFNGAYYKKSFTEMLKSPAFMYLGGVIALVVGFLIVNAHNVWVKDWTVIVTIIGWLALIKGILILVAPKLLVNIAKPMLKHTAVLGVCVVIMGLVFGYFGWCV